MNIQKHQISQSDVKVVCKCGYDMNFCYYEFAYSQFQCPNCNAVFVHDDWNEPNDNTIERNKIQHEYKRKEEVAYW